VVRLGRQRVPALQQVVTAVTLRCVPAFALHAVEEPARLDDLLERWDTLPAEADHVEFYWFPHTRDCQLKRNTRVPLSALDPPPRWRALVDGELVPNVLFGAVCRVAARAPAVVPPFNRLATRLLGHRSYTDRSHRVFTATRRVRFRETEWAVPRAAVPDLLRELDATIRRRGWRITFPVEVRVTAADDRWLSPAYGRETAYVAAHRYVREPHADYFAAVEDLAGVAGRPHWGKVHTLDAAALAPRYPCFAAAVALRDRVDPGGLFGNAYTDRVLGPSAERGASARAARD
jgi:L-gulonolactone oxidase